MGIPNRIIVVDMLSWIPGESGQGQPAEGRFCRWLNTDLDPCGPRNFKATPNWTPIDLGWLKDAPISFLHVMNNEGNGLLVNPSKEEKERVSALTLEIALSESGIDAPLLCRSGTHIRIEVSDPSKLRIRCANGNCKYALTVFPA